MKRLILLAGLISATAAHADTKSDFQNFCERAIKAQLTQPATFKPDYFGATLPHVVTFPADGTSAWLWTVPFTASNAFGAVGSYRAACSQAPDGHVFAIIKSA